MTIKEALYKLSVLKDETYKLQSKLNEYRNTPITINGEKIVTSKQESEVEDILDKMGLYEVQIERLQSKINKANLEHGMLDKIDKVKRARSILKTLEIIYSEKCVVEHGNVIQYGLPSIEKIKGVIEHLKQIIPEYSLEIEKLNSEIEIRG